MHYVFTADGCHFDLIELDSFDKHVRHVVRTILGIEATPSGRLKSLALIEGKGELMRYFLEREDRCVILHASQTTDT